MHNIAEGFDAGSDAEFARFLRYTRRSATEVQSELYVALDQQYISHPEFTELYDLAEQCKKATNGLIRYLSPESRSPESRVEESRVQSPESRSPESGVGSLSRLT